MGSDPVYYIYGQSHEKDENVSKKEKFLSKCLADS